MIAPAIRLALLTETDVTDLVGSRVYFQRLPQEPTLPALVIELISGDPNNAVNSVPSLVWSRIRIISWGATYRAANELSQAVENALNARQFSADGTEIRSIVADTLRDFYEPAVEAYHSSQDFKIWHTF